MKEDFFVAQTTMVDFVVVFWVIVKSLFRRVRTTGTAVFRSRKRGARTQCGCVL